MAGCFFTRTMSQSPRARDFGDWRDNKGKLAKRVFTCLYPEFTALFWNVILAKDMKYGNISSDSEPAKFWYFLRTAQEMCRYI